MLRFNVPLPNKHQPMHNMLLPDRKQKIRTLQLFSVVWFVIDVRQHYPYFGDLFINIHPCGFPSFSLMIYNKLHIVCCATGVNAEKRIVAIC